MIEQELHRLEKVINDKDAQINLLKQQLHGLRSKANIINEGPQIQNRLIVDSDFSTNIELLENRIARLTFQNLQYKQACDDRNKMICDLQVKIMQLQGQLEIMRNQGQMKKACRGRLDTCTSSRLEAHIQEMNTQIQHLIDEKITLVKASQQLSRQLYVSEQNFLNLSSSYEQHLKDFQQTIGKLTNSQKHVVPDKYTEIGRLKEAIESLKVELSSKNHEIIQLHQIISLNKDLCLEKTLYFLRGQLEIKSKLVRQVINKLQFAHKLIKDLQRGLSQNDDLPQKLTRLSQDLKQLQSQNSALKQQIKQLSKSLRENEQEKSDFSRCLEEVLIQNENYHRLMFEEFGEAHREKIKDKRMKLQEQICSRNKDKRWTSVSQLVQVNRALHALIDERQNLKISY